MHYYFFIHEAQNNLLNIHHLHDDVKYRPQRHIVITCTDLLIPMYRDDAGNRLRQINEI